MRSSKTNMYNTYNREQGNGYVKVLIVSRENLHGVYSKYVYSFNTTLTCSINNNIKSSVTLVE